MHYGFIKITIDSYKIRKGVKTLKKIYEIIMELLRKALNASAKKSISSKSTKRLSVFMDKVFNLYDKLFNDELKYMKNN